METMKICTKKDAEAFLLEYKEYTHNSFLHGLFWFRDDGPATDEFKTHEYTINHEEEGIIGVSKEDAIDYIFRNRKRLNSAEPTLVTAIISSNG